VRGPHARGLTLLQRWNGRGAESRRERVFAPRVGQATWGERMMPQAFWTNRIFFATSGLWLVTDPPTVALWPSRYLVVL
jgi:hypothetical protein